MTSQQVLPPDSMIVSRTGTAERQLGAEKADPVEQVVAELNRICKAATFQFATAVGSLIIARFYGGNLDAWRTRGIKDCSLRKLARHPHLPMSAVALYRSIAIYEMCERLGISRCRHLSTSHLRTVLPLSADQQEALLRTAETDRWTVRRLEEEVQAVGTQASTRGGRKRRTRMKKTIRLLQKCLDDSNGFVGANDDPDPSPESVRTFVEVIRGLQEACAKLQIRLAFQADGERNKTSQS